MSTGIIFASIALYKIRTFQVSDLDNEYSGQNYIAFRIITIVSAAVFCLMYLTLATNDSTYLSASLLYLLFKADECFSDVLYGIEQRNERMDYIGKSQIIRGIVSLGGFSIPLALTGNLHMALVCMTVCCMLVTLLYDLGHAHLFGPVRPHIALPKAYSLARACFLAMVASLLANSIVSVVRQYFGIAHGDEALGIYASVATPAVLVQVAANYLYSPMVGELSRSWKHDHAATFRKKFLKVLSLILLVVGTLIAVLSPFGGALLEIVYGESIAPPYLSFPLCPNCHRSNWRTLLCERCFGYPEKNESHAYLQCICAGCLHCKRIRPHPSGRHERNQLRNHASSHSWIACRFFRNPQIIEPPLNQTICRKASAPAYSAQQRRKQARPTKRQRKICR